MTRELKVENLTINDDNPSFVIAEIGHNHQGSLEKAKQFFDEAKRAGASAVKLQKRDNRRLFTKELYDQVYDNENSYGRTYGEHREALEFGKKEYAELQAYAREMDIIFFATAFDHYSADFLAELDMPAYKFASADLINTPLQKHVAKFGKPMFLSCGGGDLNDIRRAVDTILPINKNLSVLHCTASYPADVSDMNLRVITELRRVFPDLVIGLSDHENGIDAASIAFMLGARVFEKHFTLNRAWKGTDQSFSLEPEGMRKLVRNLNRIPLALGDGNKRLMESEKKPLQKMGKQLVAARALPAGHVLAEADIAIKSPGGGLPPYRLDEVLGKKTRAALSEDDPIPADLLK